MKIKDILKVTNGEMLVGNEELTCENFSKDTRTIQKGDIYIGLKGENFDGSQFWKQALESGAEAVIVQDVKISPIEMEKYSNKTIVKVEDTLKALYEDTKNKNIFSYPFW